MIVILVLLLILPAHAASTCSGSFPNIVTDICWECVFPIRIGGVNLTPSYDDVDEDEGGSPICFCPKPPLGQPTPGIKVSFWEPVRMVDVTRTPYCLVNLGGLKIAGGDTFKNRGTIGLTEGGGGLKHSFYQVHWYVFPVFYVFELLLDFICVESAAFDLAYISELDPFWNNDELAILHNPEALVFANLPAQAACAADCAKASFGFGFDSLFWCAGCHGSVYPFTGSVPAHVSSVQATELLTTRFIAKLHRYGLLQGYSGFNALCGKSYMPIIKKSQYKLQMLNPVPATDNACVPLGRSDFLHPRHETREIIKSGNHYGYLVWRRRSCCLL